MQLALELDGGHARALALLGHSRTILHRDYDRAQDLLDCRDLMRVAMDSLPSSSGLQADFLRFEYASVYVPTLNNLIRRRARDAQANAVRRRIRGEMRLSEMLRLARAGRPSLAVAAAGMKFAHPLYAWAYLGFRRLKWGSDGFWTG